MSTWQVFKQWVDLMWHHATNGTLPPVPTEASGPVSVPPAATPVAPPAVVAAPTPVAPPLSTVTEWVNGMSQPDSLGFVKLQLIEQQRAYDPRWSKVAEWYSIKDILTTFTLTDEQRLNVEANMVECAVTANGPLAGDHPFDGRALTQAFLASAPTRPGATYSRGPQLFNTMSFASGFVDKPDPTVADLPAFIAACNASGVYPVINHGGVGAVA